MATVKNQPATKQDLDSFHKKMKGEFATKDDLKAFATKDDLKKTHFLIKDDIEDLEDRFDNKLTTFKSEILDAVDGVMGEIKKVRENQEAHNFSHERIDDELEGHETRIGNLEKTSVTV